jgi:hypothetical protein
MQSYNVMQRSTQIDAVGLFAWCIVMLVLSLEPAHIIKRERETVRHVRGAAVRCRL